MGFESVSSNSPALIDNDEDNVEKTGVGRIQTPLASSKASSLFVNSQL